MAAADITAGRFYQTRTVDSTLAWVLAALRDREVGEARTAFRDITGRCGAYVAQEARAALAKARGEEEGGSRD